MNRSTRPWRALAALLIVAWGMAACGGVDSGGTGLTTQTTSTGRISGFGSIIVNGVRFDDTQARVVDDDGVARSRSELRLGMVVEVQGEAHLSNGTGSADRIQFGNEIAGPVEAVNVAASQLTVLGQPVQVDVDTLFDNLPNGLASVQVGQLVEVFGFLDPGTGTYAATRIERKTSLGAFKLRGRVAALSTADRRFSIGGALIDYTGIPQGQLPTLANGLSVRVTLATTPVAGRWIASRMHTSQRNFPDNREAEFEGHVSGFVSPADFLVGGVPVDASGPGVRVRHGSLSDLANSVRVEVEGEMRNGVLIASGLDFKRGGQEAFELHGTIESLDLAGRSLVLRGTTVRWDDDTRFNAGNAGQLAVGVQIEVRGEPSGGVVLLAESIRFE